MMTLQNMTTPLRALLPAALMLLAATACEDTLDNPAAHTGNGPALTLVLDNNEDNAGTRTELSGSDATHHVKTVDILIFEGKGNDATYVGKETVDWPKPVETVDAQPVNRMTYPLEQTFTDGKNYILLGVGKDEPFNSTYNIDAQGKKLGEVYAILKAEADKDDIAACEFFTGTVSFTYQKEVQIDDLLMKRRVAGVMLYVTEIPQELTQSDGTYHVTKVQLCLGPDMKQNKSVLLKREFDAENWTEPTQESLDDSNVLAEIDLSNLEYTQGADFYMENGEAAKRYAGLYMLPLDATEDKPTFLIKLRGKKDDGSGTLGEEEELSKAFVVENHSEGSTSFPVRSNYIYCIGEKNVQEGIDEPVSLSGTAIYLQVKDWEDIVTDNTPDFGPARVMAVFDDTNNPVYNCMNDWHRVQILPPLSSIQKKVTKIVVKVTDIMEVDETNEDDVQFNQDWLFIENYDENLSEREYDTYVSEKELYNKNKDGEFTNFINQGSNIVADGVLRITIFMEDYARQREWGWKEGKWEPTPNDIRNIANDWREANLKVETYLEGEELPRTDVMTIRQYNTITALYQGTNGVDLDDKDEKENAHTYCGFSREDLKDENGDPVEMQWGFPDLTQTNIWIYLGDGTGSRGSGSWNVSNIRGNYFNLLNENVWKASAMYKSQYAIRKINDETGKMDKHQINEIDKERTEVAWYLPAEFEIEALLTMGAYCENNGYGSIGNFTNLDTYKYYWTSTTAGNGTSTSSGYVPYLSTIIYRYTMTYSIYQYERDAMERRNEDSGNTRIRQARKFPYKFENDGDDRW